MFHSGVKHDDLIRLNRLGICMSPDSTIRLKKQMNEQLEGKVQIWKGIIVENCTVLELGKEVLRKQNTAPQLDVRKCSLETYDFSPAGYDALIKLLDVQNTRTNSNVYTDKSC